MEYIRLQRWRQGNKRKKEGVGDARQMKEMKREAEREGKKQWGSLGLYECSHILSSMQAFIDTHNVPGLSSEANHLGRIIWSELL